MTSEFGFIIGEVFKFIEKEAQQKSDWNTIDTAVIYYFYYRFVLLAEVFLILQQKGSDEVVGYDIEIAQIIVVEVLSL